MKIIKSRWVVAWLFLVGSSTVSADISGMVFADYNGNGVHDVSVDYEEKGKAGITVTAYEPSGAVVGAPVTTGFDGSYTISTSYSGKARVEFTWATDNDWLNPSVSNGGTQVQFVSAPTTDVNLGIMNPVMYCEADPQVVTIENVRGPLSSNGGEITIKSSYVSDAVGTGSIESSTDTDHNISVNVGQTGSVWGLAYNKQCEKIFVASNLKGQVEVGAEGLGAIYQLDNSLNSGTNSVTSASLWLDLANFGIDIGANPYTTPLTGPTVFHRESFRSIGKHGLGGIDVADDASALYAINLHNRSIVTMPLGNACSAPSSPAQLTEVVIPNPSSCDDVVRPWAVKYHEGQVYVGMVCTGEQANVNAEVKTDVIRDDLRAYVYQFDPDSLTFASSPAVEFSLLYDRAWVSREAPAAWMPWQDRFVYDLYYVRDKNGFSGYAQPILSDIEFEGCDMMMSFADRMSWQFDKGAPPQSERPDGSLYSPSGGMVSIFDVMPGGDLLIAGYNGNDTWTLEDDGVVTSVCGNRSTVNANPNTDRRAENPAPYNDPAMGSGPGQTLTNATDFFWYDGYGQHDEVMVGAMAIQPGYKQVINVAYDNVFHMGSSATDGGSGPNAGFNIGGLVWLNTDDGTYEKSIKLYDGVGTNLNFGKGAGFGDVELLCDEPPVEIGDFVWRDSDGDGIQDADEAGIENVSIELIDASNTNVVASAVTNADGHYIFSSASGVDTTSHKYNLNLINGSHYQVRIANAEGSGQQSALNGLSVTNMNADASLHGDLRDSDGSRSSDSVIAMTLGSAGQNNHSYDFGFKAAQTCSINATATVNACTNTGNDIDASNDVYTITLNVSGENTSTHFNYSSTAAGIGENMIEFSASPFTTPAIPIEGSGSPHTITVSDSSDSSCSSIIVPAINKPLTCSNAPSQVDLSLSKTVNVSAAASGDTIVYTITVNNSSSIDATGVVIRDPLPATKMTYVSDDGGSATTVDGSGVVMWNVDSIPAGESRSLNITVRVN